MEPARNWMLAQAGGAPSSRMADLGINATAATLAGGLAAAVTTPFDVAKTKIQTADSSKARQRSLLAVMTQLAQVGLARMGSSCAMGSKFMREQECELPASSSTRSLTCTYHCFAHMYHNML